MLIWAIIFFAAALIAAVFGFGGVPSVAAGVAQILFFLFLFLFVVSLTLTLGRKREEDTGGPA